MLNGVAEETGGICVSAWIAMIEMESELGSSSEVCWCHFPGLLMFFQGGAIM